jgi:hypothetical protein
MCFIDKDQDGCSTQCELELKQLFLIFKFNHQVGNKLVINFKALKKRLFSD